MEKIKTTKYAGSTRYPQGRMQMSNFTSYNRKKWIIDINEKPKPMQVLEENRKKSFLF